MVDRFLIKDLPVTISFHLDNKFTAIGKTHKSVFSVHDSHAAKVFDKFAIEAFAQVSQILRV